jgi:putative redox protein
MELVLLGLAGCTAMDVISILRKKRQHVTGFEVEAHAERADEHPKVFTSILVKFLIEGINVDPEAVRRSIELSETRYCPVQAMLAPGVHIRNEYEIVEVAAGEAI